MSDLLTTDSEIHLILAQRRIDEMMTEKGSREYTMCDFCVSEKRKVCIHRDIFGEQSPIAEQKLP